MLVTEFFGDWRAPVANKARYVIKPYLTESAEVGRDLIAASEQQAKHSLICLEGTT